MGRYELHTCTHAEWCEIDREIYWNILLLLKNNVKFTLQYNEFYYKKLMNNYRTEMFPCTEDIDESIFNFRKRYIYSYNRIAKRRISC